MSLNLYAVCNILYVANPGWSCYLQDNPVAFCGNILCRIGAVEDYAHLTPFSALGVIYCVAHNTLWNIGKICKAVGCCSSRIRECRKSVTDFIKTPCNIQLHLNRDRHFPSQAYFLFCLTHSCFHHRLYCDKTPHRRVRTEYPVK